MNYKIPKIILYSKNGYDKRHDELLQNLIDKKVWLFCVVGKDCEMWHDAMDDFFIGYGEERDFFMITTWHQDETLEDVIQFAKNYNIRGIDNEKVQIIEV